MNLFFISEEYIMTTVSEQKDKEHLFARKPPHDIYKLIFKEQKEQYRGEKVLRERMSAIAVRKSLR